jgi:hypothetical protein
MPAAAAAASSDRPTAICVLGPGRSGTSLTVRLLGLGGVYLGDDGELLTASGIPANPKGFWEHRAMARINQRVLKALGGSWSEPPPLPPGWEQSNDLAGEREDARGLLERTFGGHDLWGWKDARNSLTLPFWQNLLPAERYDVRYVICLRNPLDVIDSLKPPRPQSRRETGALWLTYVASALVNTAGRPRILVPYEDYFRDWRGTVERLLGFAGCPMPTAGSEVEARMREFTDAGLWRHRTGAEAVMRDPDIPEPAHALHLIAELLASSPDLDPPLAGAVDVYAKGLLETAGKS